MKAARWFVRYLRSVATVLGQMSRLRALETEPEVHGDPAADVQWVVPKEKILAIAADAELKECPVQLGFGKPELQPDEEAEEAEVVKWMELNRPFTVPAYHVVYWLDLFAAKGMKVKTVGLTRAGLDMVHHVLGNRMFRKLQEPQEKPEPLVLVLPSSERVH